MNKYLASLIDILFHVLPMDRNMFLFSSFNGLYNDNPRYISEELHKRCLNMKIVWVIDERANPDDIPTYIKQVKPMSFEYLYYKNRSKTLIDNFTGYTGGRHRPRFFWQFLFKKHNQLNFSTYHGTAVKKIGNDTLKAPRNHYFTTTAMLLNSDYMINLIKKAKSEQLPCYKTGSPRNDLLFENNIERKNQLRLKLGLPFNKKIVLFAPTYRSTNKDINGEEFSIYLSDNEISVCLSSLKKRFGGEWVFVYRAHQKVLNAISSKLAFDNHTLFNGNSHDDMSEYLLLSDFLITDYSSCLYDFTITKRPCMLYVPDYEHYKNEGRGLYVDIERLPYPSARNFDIMIRKIENYNMDETLQKIKELNEAIGLCDDGNASFRAVNMMLNSLK